MFGVVIDDLITFGDTFLSLGNRLLVEVLLESEQFLKVAEVVPMKWFLRIAAGLGGLVAVAVLVLLGLGTRIASILLVNTMVVAIATWSRNAPAAPSHTEAG